LSPHTDGTIVADQAGLEVFHCVKHNGTGGETILIDGFYIAEKIKQDHPDVYERLCKTNFTSSYVEPGVKYSHTAPFFNLDPVTNKISKIRYNHVHRSPTVASSNVRQYYHDLKVLTRYIDNPENQTVFKLNPGTVMIFDNWRLLHGRTAFDGIRALTGCYVARDEFQSFVRCHGLID
jgi:alpha-ketoglutarate-dependent taurine dioxygenase